MAINEVELIEVKKRILSTASFFTNDQQVLRDLTTVIEELGRNISKDFYSSEEMSLEEVEQFYLQYIIFGLEQHIKGEWEDFPRWQKLIFSFSYYRAFRRISKIHLLVASIVAGRNCR